MSESNDRQRMPRKGHVEVAPIAHVTFALMLAAAKRRGLASYHRPLETHNGRDVWRDLMEEQVDAWQYTIQAKLEAQGLVADYHRLMVAARDLVDAIPAEAILECGVIWGEANTVSVLEAHHALSGLLAAYDGALIMDAAGGPVDVPLHAFSTTAGANEPGSLAVDALWRAKRFLDKEPTILSPTGKLVSDLATALLDSGAVGLAGDGIGAGRDTDVGVSDHHSAREE